MTLCLIQVFEGGAEVQLKNKVVNFDLAFAQQRAQVNAQVRQRPISGNPQNNKRSNLSVMLRSKK
jgi:hypothetical protein